MKKVMLTLLVAIFATVTFGQNIIRTEIKASDLPKCVIEWTKKTMSAYTIDKAIRIDEKTPAKVVTTHYVKYVKGGESQWMFFNDGCGTIKKVTEAQIPNPKTKPPVKPDPTSTPAVVDPGVQPKK